MTIYYPEAVPTLGNTKLTAVLAVADMAAPKLATELNATTSTELTCAVFPEGWNPTAETGRGERRRRLCSKRTVQQFNPTTYSMPDLQYAHDPQGANTDADNKARNMLTPGLEIFLVERQGLDAETVDWAVGQKVLVHKVRLGEQIWSGDRTDVNGEFFITQPVIYTGDGPVEGTIAA